MNLPDPASWHSEDDRVFLSLNLTMGSGFVKL